MSNDSASLPVALLGYGLAGAAFHAPLIAATPGLELAAVVTSDPARQAQVAKDHPDAEVVPSAEQIWTGRRRYDLVVVATPNRTHAPLASSAIGAGIPVVVDKPFATAPAEGAALIAEAQRHGVMLTVFQNRRWDGDFLTVRRLLEEGAFGTVHRFESRFERWRPTPKGGWRETGGPADAAGLLFDLGSHLIDQALQLFGPAAAVYAEADARRSGITTDDDSFVALTHLSGVRSHLWMSAVTAQLGPRMRVLGSIGAYTKYGLDVQEAALRAGGRPDMPGWGEEPLEAWGQLGADGDLRTVPTEPGAYQEFYTGVAAALRVGSPPPVDPREALEALHVIEAAHRSAASGKVIRLEPLPAG